MKRAWSKYVKKFGCACKIGERSHRHYTHFFFCWISVLACGRSLNFINSFSFFGLSYQHHQHFVLLSSHSTVSIFRRFYLYASFLLLFWKIFIPIDPQKKIPKNFLFYHRQVFIFTYIFSSFSGILELFISKQLNKKRLFRLLRKFLFIMKLFY